jgi:P-type Ca2+ transporter type 2C
MDKASAFNATGLTSSQAAKRLAKYGPNQLKQPWLGSFLKRLVAPLTSAFVLVLLVGAAVSYATGNRSDAVIIVVIVGIAAAIDWSQQYSASRILKSLNHFNTKIVKVRRNNKIAKLDSRQIVPGDVVLLNQGEKVPADGKVLNAHNLSVDESSLTGESLAVAKDTQQHDQLYSGCLIQSGRAEMSVTATGSQTKLNQIAALSALASDKPPIDRKIRQLTYRLAMVALLLGGLVFAAGVWQGNGVVEMARFGIALVVAMIPEGLPVTLSVILMLGVKRIANQKALVRNLAAIETMGMVTAIATDKTGTLTQNQLGIGEMWDLDGRISREDNEDFWMCVSHRHPDLEHPIERLITEYVQSHLKGTSWQETFDEPFDNTRRFSITGWQKDHLYRTYIKGAAEVVIERCRLTPNQQKLISLRLKSMMSRGMRVIAIASSESTQPFSGEASLQKLHFQGIIGFVDQLRPEAKAAIAATQAAGIKTYLLSGDHLETSRTVAMQTGIITQAAEGSLVANTDIKKLPRLLKKIKAFGRILPEHKYKFLEALKQTEIAAMTGDGVNDAPALVKADVGIAMGSGTDAAQEAGDIILLDDNYATITKAIAEGRRIYANIRKMIYYIVGSNFAMVITIVASLILGVPTPFTATAVLWNNLITDTMMVLPLGLEPAEAKQMQQPPRSPQAPLLGKLLFSRTFLAAVVVAACTLFVYKLYLPQQQLASTIAFITIVSGQWTNAVIARSSTASLRHLIKTPNWFLLAGVALGVLLQLMALFTPLRTYLGMGGLEFTHLLWTFLPVSAVILTGQVHKAITKNRSD